MVAFNACFTLLPAFCSLAGVTLGPTSAHAAAVHSPGFQESYLQAPFKVPRSATHEGKHAKRHPRCKDGSLLDVELLNFIEIAIGKAYCKYHHERRSSVVIPGQDGASYYVAASHRPPQIEQRHRKIKGLSARDEDRLAGRVNVLSHDDGSGEDTKIASLLVESGTRNLVASKTAFTQIYLVNVPMDRSSMPDVVALQILGKPDVDPDCVTYGIRDSSSLTVQPCTPKAQTNASQFFEYDKTKGVLRPFSEGVADSKNSTFDNSAASTESVDLDDRDGTSIEIDNVTLVFVPDSQPASAQEAAVELPSVVTSTTTLITTVTVTSSATPSAAAQDVTPTASNGTTSSTASASPTPSSNEFKVKVVGPESSSGSESSTSEPPATPTSVNAEEVASRIAAGAASATSTDTSATSPTAAALAGAALDETTMPSGTQITTSSTTPSSFAPYSSTPTGTPTPAALAAVDMSVSSISSATGRPTASLTNSPTPTGTPVPAALAAVDNSAPSSRSTGTPASNDNSSSSTAAPGPMVTPLNVLMESQD